jgi:hypothetical protein
VNKKFIALSALMLIAAANSGAVSLGRHRGAVLIGRSLDVSVQAVLDAQEDVAGLCLDADVFYADNRLDKARVRVTAEKVSAGSQDALIRIRATSVVDEPVVTIYLRVGCLQKTERRYVTLADLASDVVTDRNAVNLMSPLAQVSPPLPILPAANSAAVTPSTTRPVRKGRKSSDSATPASPAKVVDADKPEITRKSGAKKQERTPAPALAAAKTSPSSRGRLKLEPLDLSIDRDPLLKSSAELLTLPAASPQERSAAAALWRAITAQPQDILRDAEKQQTLESSVRSLQAQSQKTQQSINEMSVKLQQAESERYANALVYTLGLLLLLALAGLGYVMRHKLFRQRFAGRDTPWWRKSESQQSLRQAWVDSDVQSDGFDSIPDSDDKKNKSEVSAGARLTALSDKSDPAHADLKSPTQTSRVDFDSMPPLASRYRPDFALSMPHASRAVKAEELFDVQQQADFFVSIGQNEQAIEVLRNHIGDDVETSALVYLDLFNLYHQMERKADYAGLRDDFNRRFNTKIPVFEMYTDAGPGLEAYQTAMSRIQSLWPSPKVLEIIEESIFRQPETDAEAFNLEAYRELLLLYSVAKEIIAPESKSVAKPSKSGKSKKFDLAQTPADDPDVRPTTFVSTAIQPLSASMDDDQAVHAEELLAPLLASTVPPASLNLGLDVDLSEPMPGIENALPVDVSDAQFFAQFDKPADDGLPSLDPAVQNAEKLPSDADNLIDFDAFDMALSANQKPKQPKG